MHQKELRDSPFVMELFVEIYKYFARKTNIKKAYNDENAFYLPENFPIYYFTTSVKESIDGLM